MPKHTMSNKDKAVLRQWFDAWYRRPDSKDPRRAREVYNAAMELLQDEEDEQC